MLKIQENRLRSWERRGWCEHRTRFGFADLIQLRALQQLRENRISPNRIDDALSSLMKKLPGVERPLSELRIVSSGKRVAVELPNGTMEATTGQMLFNFDSSAGKTVQVIPQIPERDASARLQEAEHWFRRGLELEEQGAKFESAMEAYRQALELNPSAAGAWVNIGTLCYRQGDYEQAEHCYRQALHSSPNYPLALFNLGNICEEMDRLNEAINYYKVALQLHPSYADVHYNLALAYERMREPMRAAKHWRQYLKLDSASPWAGIARQQLSNLLPVTPGGKASKAKE